MVILCDRAYSKFNINHRTACSVKNNQIRPDQFQNWMFCGLDICLDEWLFSRIQVCRTMREFSSASRVSLLIRTCSIVWALTNAMHKTSPTELNNYHTVKPMILYSVKKKIFECYSLYCSFWRGLLVDLKGKMKWFRLWVN